VANIRIACHAITWGRDGLEQCIEDITELGFRGIETFAFVVDDYAGREQQFRDMLAAKRLQLVCLYGGGALIDPAIAQEEIEKNLRFARFLQACGADRLTLGGGTRRPEGNTPDDYRQMARTMEEIGRRTLDMGILSCYHPHYGTAVQNRDEITTIFELCDPRYVFMTADPAHMAKAGYDPVEVFRTYRDRIKYVHMKDYKPLTPAQETEQQRQRTARQSGAQAATAIITDFVELGEGIIDIPALFRVLEEAGYDGWVTLELDRSTRTPRISTEMNKRYIEEKLGLKVG
jgi:inosose dehydratase